MKKRFALYGMFAAMAIFATACGDDSSSGPEEESSSSIEAEDESSSSVEEEGKSSAKEEGKSSAAGKKSSSSEAKKGDSSSSEEASSSSSEAVSSSGEISYEPTCVVKTEGSVASVETHFYATDMGGDVEQVMELDYEKYELLTTVDFAIFAFWGFESCEDVNKLPMVQSGAMIVKNCSDENKTIDQIVPYDPDDFEQNFGTIANAKEAICGSFLSEFTVDTTALNQEMLAAGKYGTFRDTRDAMLYRTIKIGNQTWMAQNLLYETESGSSCYGAMPEGTINGNCLVYGRLYTWEAAQTACPTGWRLPSVKEWETLLVTTMNATKTMEGGAYITYSGADISLLGGGSYANSYGLSFVLGGAYGEPGDETPEYNSLGSSGVYWLGDEPQEGNVPVVSVEFDDGTSERSNQFVIPESGLALSVRCIKDDAPSQSVSSN